MMTFAKIDIASIDWYWDQNFKFQETAPLTPKFEMSGMETKNFLFNTGSLFVNGTSIILSSILFYLIKLFGLKYIKNPFVLVLTKYFTAPRVRASIVLFLYSFTTDTVLCSLLLFYAYSETPIEDFMEYPAERANLALAIIFSGSCIVVTIYSIYLVQTTEDLDSEEFRS
jgi:hypothetical protein